MHQIRRLKLKYMAANANFLVQRLRKIKETDSSSTSDDALSKSIIIDKRVEV